ncbi:MAG: hypothetical protein HYS08_06265 [Chlamydiae bacterium]|nr:hypothetical protein [Chlamydiota bacterium]MBI3266982.1 hypothetical protein [Chlamydiota bacterium]
MRFNTYPELIGQSLTGLDVKEERGLEVLLDKEYLLERVDVESSVLPTWITGRVDGNGNTDHLDLAIAVNGRICTTTRAFRENGNLEFSVMIPWDSLRHGTNDVQVFTAARKSGKYALASLKKRLFSFVQEGDLTYIKDSKGKSYQVLKNGLEGQVDWLTFNGHAVRIYGWAADVKNKELPQNILVYDEEHRFVFEMAVAISRIDVAKRFGNSKFLWCGFNNHFFVHPAQGNKIPRFHVFAVSSRGTASELGYNRSVLNQWK